MHAARLLPLMLFAACLPEATFEADTSSAATRWVEPSPNGVYIVVLERGDPASVAATVGVRPDFIYDHALLGFAATLSPQALHGLAQNPAVRSIQPDRLVFAVDQVVPTGVDRIDADLDARAAIDGTPTAVNADIAVIDTGVDDIHPELTVFRSVDCTGGPFTQRCANGSGDGNGHGTHVAGTAAAIDNGAGVVGVAPGARIWSVQVLKSDGSGWWSNVIAGIDYVAANADKIEVANMSLGGGGSDDTDGRDCSGTGDAMHLAICGATGAGVVFTVAAGNSRDDAANHVPAAYDEVLTVSAFADFDGAAGGAGVDEYGYSSCTEARDDSFACFSNFGHDVDIMAPGVGIFSTWTGSDYKRISGTSMSSPHVAGAVALHLSENPKPTDRAGVLAVHDAIIAAGDPAPCATASGACTDDPDGIHEPLLYLGGGFVASGCSSDADCDDTDACTTDACTSGTCSNEPLDCDDADACTDDGCADGVCSNLAVSCDDGDPCTLDSCHVLGGCINEQDPACGSCGDGVCGDGEDCFTCSSDCSCRGKDCTKTCCGNGVCEHPEGVGDCAVDCG